MCEDMGGCYRKTETFKNQIEILGVKTAVLEIYPLQFNRRLAMQRKVSLREVVDTSIVIFQTETQGGKK